MLSTKRLPEIGIAGVRPNRMSLQTDGSERWYVVMTQAKKEQFAAENLRNQGIRCFVPLQTTTYRHARRFSTKLAPAFPQYAFVILDPKAHRWRVVNGTFGVRRLICDARGPVPIRSGVVETLVASCDVKGVLAFQDSSLKPGDSVRLVSGPFAGAFGALQSLDASGRVRLLLEIMNGSVSVTADAGAVAPVLVDHRRVAV